MTVDGTRRVLRPGERYQIAVTFTPPSSSADRDAQFRRFILLSAKTSSGPTQIELAITGILPADVSLRYFPSTIDVGRLEPGSLTHRTVHLIGSADVIASTGGSPRLKTQQDSSLSIPDGASSNRKLAEKDVDVLIEVPHDVPAGLWQKSISLKAEGNATDFRISVRGQTVPPIWATRPIVILPNFIGPSAPQVETTLNTTDGENLSIVGTDTSLPIVLEYQKVPGPHRGAVTIGIRLARRVYAPATGDIQVRLKHNGNMTVSRIQAVILDSEPSTNTGPELSGILK